MGTFSEGLKEQKLIVYTVSTGGYDGVLEPLVTDENTAYIFYTDRPPENYTGVWEFRPVENPDKLDPGRLSRYYKFHPHVLFPNDEYSVYIDANTLLKKSLRAYIDRYSKDASMLCQRHSERNCLYNEAKIVTSYRFDDPAVVSRQMQRYRAEGFPEHYGMIEANVLSRRHHDQPLIAVMETWWDEVLNGSRRDQLSFSYAVWKNHYTYDAAPICSFDNENWTALGHGNAKRRMMKSKAPSLFTKEALLYLIGKGPMP